MSALEVMGGDFLSDETKFRNMLLLSVTVHLVTLALFLFLPNLQIGKRINPSPGYTVNLVSLGELTGMKSPGDGAPNHVVKAKQALVAKEPARIQKSVEVKKLEPTKLVAQKAVIPKSIPSLDKKPEKPKEEPAKQASNPGESEEHLEQALNRIKENLGSGARGQASGATAGVGVQGGSGAAQIPEMVVYTSIVIDRIMEAWFLPPSLKQEAYSRNFLTIIDIRIDRQGKVSLQGVERNSGNPLYDDYALAAIKKVQSETFPPLPEVFREQYLDLGIRFQPSEANFS
jgi:outer membrane biosynthesis protein TonB